VVKTVDDFCLEGCCKPLIRRLENSYKLNIAFVCNAYKILKDSLPRVQGLVQIDLGQTKKTGPEMLGEILCQQR
jgi:hypothetical protein